MAPTLAQDLNKSAALFERMCAEADRENPINQAVLEAVGSVYEKAAIETGALAELVGALERLTHRGAITTIQHVAAAITKLSSLTTRATVLLDLRLS